MKTFIIDNFEIEVTNGQEAYNSLRIKYQDIAEAISKQFENQYDVLFDDIDDIHCKTPELVQKYLLSTVDTAIRDIIEAGITDISDDGFINKYVSPRITWEEDFSKIDDQYLKIALDTEAYDDYKKSRPSSGGSIMGGGFGVEGAVQGMAIATAANLAIGAVGGILNAASDGLNSMGEKKLKKDLFDNSNTKLHLINSVYNLVFQIHLAVIDAISERSENNIYENISELNQSKANAILENINKERISEKNIKKSLIDALKLNPYEQNLYLLWIKNYGDKDNKLENIANYFGVKSVNKNKQEIFFKYKQSLGFHTSKQCEDSLIKLEKYSTSNGLMFIYEEEQKKILLDLKKLKKLEKRKVLLNYKNSLKFSTLTECKDSLLKLEEYANTNDLVEFFYEEKNKIQSLIKSIDLETRTTNGKLFDTPEEAEKKSEELEQVRKFSNVDILFGISIIIAPLPNAFLTLKSKYTLLSRVMALIWMFIFCYFLFSSSQKDEGGILLFIELIVAFLFIGSIVFAIRLLITKILNYISTPLINEEKILTVLGVSYRKSEYLFYTSAFLFCLILISSSIYISSEEHKGILEERAALRLASQSQAVPKPLVKLRDGKLTVRSNVIGDIVTLNGEKQGTHLDLKLKPGIYALKVSKEGYEPWEKQLDIRAGSNQVVYAKLKHKVINDVEDPKLTSNNHLKSMLKSNPESILSPKPKNWPVNSDAHIIRDSTTGMELVKVPKGCFQMGSNNDNNKEKPAHKVCITQPFYIGKYEVTQVQWRTIMDENPSKYKKEGNLPVENVSWSDVQKFISRLNQKTRLNYRLPTEAEWEFSCRSGGKKQKYCGGDNIDSLAWHNNNSNSTHPVGQKSPNDLGLHDMSGNVWEWVEDNFSDNYYNNSPTNNPLASFGVFYVNRGGGYNNGFTTLRSTNRDYNGLRFSSGNLGFRLAKSL